MYLAKLCPDILVAIDTGKSDTMVLDITYLD